MIRKQRNGVNPKFRARRRQSSLARDGPRYGDSLGIQGSHETIAGAVAEYPELFVGFACLDPREPDYMDRLRRSVSESGFKGVKYGPIYSGIGPGDESVQPVHSYLRDDDLPLTLHMGRGQPKPIFFIGRSDRACGTTRRVSRRR